MTDPIKIAEALRRRQALTLSNSLNRTEGLTLSTNTARNTFGVPKNLNMYDPTDTFTRIDRTMRTEAMKTATGRFMDWVEKGGDKNAALVVDNLPAVIDYSHALEDAVQHNVGNLLMVQGKNILGIGKRTASGTAAIAKALLTDPTGMSQKLDAYTSVMMGRDVVLQKDNWGNDYADDVAMFRALPPEEQQRTIDALAKVVLQRQEVQDEIRDTFQRYQREQFYTNYGRAADLRDIDTLYDFVEWSANAGSNVAATAGAVVIASYLGAAAAPVVGLSAATGGVAAAVTLSSILEASDIAGELAGAGDLNSYTAARAIAFGTLSGSVEAFVGAPKVLTRGFGRSLSKEILEAGGKRTARRLGRQFAVSSAQEMVQEGIQTYLQQLGVGGMEAVVPDSEDLWEILNGAAMGAFGGGMLSGLGSLRQMTVVRKEGKRAIGAMGYTQRMQSLFDAKSELTPQNASPKVMEEMTDALGMEGKSILFQAQDLSTWAAENGIQVPELLNELKISQVDFEAAMAADGHVSAPAGSVIAYGLTPERQGFFINNGKFEAKDYTAKEVTDVKERLEEIKAEIEAGELGPAQSDVYNHIKDMRMQSGVTEGQAHSEAVMWTAVFDTLGTYTGDGPTSILERFGVKILRGTADTAPAGLQQGAASPEIEQRFAESKLRDAEGNLRTVYHTTSADFDQFDGATYFAYTPEQAEGEGRGPIPDWMVELTGVPAEAPVGSRTIPAVLNLQNPASIEDVLAVSPDTDRIKDAIPALQEAGFDGIVTSDEVIVFDPSQIASTFSDGRTLFQGGMPLFDNPLPIEGKVTVKKIGQAMTDDHMEQYGKKLFPEDSEEDYQAVLEHATQELEAQLQMPNTGEGWYSKDVDLAIRNTAKIQPEIATEEGRAVFLTFAGIFSNGQDPSQAWAISSEAFDYWVKFREIPTNRAEASRRLGNEVKMTTFKNKAGKQVTKEAGWGIRGAANTIQLNMFKNLVEREGGPVQAVAWMRTLQTPADINEIVFTAQKAPRFKTKAEVAGPPTWGALMLSDKLGRYTLGLHGHEITADDTTVDLWYTRTYRRLTGRLMDKPIGKEGIAAQPDPARGGIERQTIFRLTGDLAQSFGLGPSDVQAMLWFFEKRLWGAQGLRVNEGTNSEGARLLLEKRGVAFDDGTGGAVASGQDPAGSPDAAGALDGRGSERGRDRGETLAGGDLVQQLRGHEGRPRPVDAVEFDAAMQTAKESLGPLAAQVSTVPADSTAQRILLDDGATGFALDGDNIIGVFSTTGGSPAGAAQRVMDIAVAMGGSRLDGFNTFLPKIYARGGFRAVARLPFDPEYAPSLEGGALANWDAEGMEALHEGWGAPDVAFMVYDPENASKDTDVVVTDYDAGVAAQDAALAEQAPTTLFQQAAFEQTAEDFVADSAVKEPQFHATNAEFDIFSNPEIGFHFAENPDLASNAAIKGGKDDAQPQAFYLNIKNPLVLDEGVDNGWPVFRTLDLLFEKGVISDNEYADAMDLYDTAEDTLAGDMTDQEFKAASAHIVTDLLEAKGYDGIKYWNTFDAGPATEADFEKAMSGEPAGPEAGWSYIAFAPEQIKSVDAQRFDPNDPRILKQKTGATPEGQIEFPAQGMGQGEDTIIRLFNITNKSTFLHESGHFFFEMYRVLANDAGAPQQVVDMWAAVNKDLGREEGDMSPLSRDHHETLARGFEAYLMTGKAPTVGLRAAFRNFAHWLTQIYKRVQSLNVELSPEITDVMERMLATQEEIQLAKDEADLSPLFPERPQGMDEAGWQAYRNAVNREEVEAESDLLKKAMGKIRREKTAAHRDEVETRADNIRDGLKRGKGYRTIERLTNEPRKEMRLNKKQLVDLFGKDAVDEIEAQLQANDLGGKYKFHSPSGGDIDMVAGALGYRDATHLMQDLKATAQSWESAEAAARSQLDQIHGDALADGTLREEAVSALQNNPKTSRMMLEAAEIRRTIEAEYGDPPAPMSMKALRLKAHRMHQAMSVKNANNPEAFLRAERKATRTVREMTGRMFRRSKGSKLQTPAREDLLRAHAAMRTAVLNQLFYIEAKRSLAIETRIHKMERLLRSSKKTSGKIDEDFLRPLNDLMEQFGFRKMAEGQLPRVADLKALEESEAGQRRADELAISPQVAGTTEFTNYPTIPVSLLYELQKTMENLNKLGRSEMKAFYEDKQMSFEALMAEALNTITAFETVEQSFSETKAEKRKINASTLYNSLKTADSILSKLDNFEFGTFQRAIKFPINAGMNRYNIRNHNSRNELGAIFKEHYPDAKSIHEKISVPELNGSWTREELVSMGLNTGNAINWNRLLSDNRWEEGYGLRDPEASIKQALENHLTENDWRYIVSMWEYIGTLWPEISAQEKKLTGVTPTSVEAQAFVTPFDFIEGGYYPIKYDRRLSAGVTANTLEETLKNMRSGRASRAQTKNGHVKDRMATTGGMPMEFSLSVAARHINEVLFDLELRQPVASAWRVLNDRRLSTLMNAKGLRTEQEALRWWIQDVANNDSGMREGWNSVFGYMRGGMTISRMGFSYTTLVQQPLGLLQTGVNVGKVRTLTQLAKYLSSPRTHEAGVKAASKAMQERQNTYERDAIFMTEALDNDPVMGKWTAFHRAVTKAAFYGIQKSQYWCVDVPSWMACYDKAISDGESHDNAVLIADALLARSQGSGVLSDRTAMERGTLSADARNNALARLATTFGSYMISAKFNSAMQRIGYFNTHRSAGELLNLMVDLIIMFSLETAASLWLTGRWPDEDDMEDEGGLPLFMAKQSAYTMMGGVPFVRDMASFFEGFGAGGPASGYLETGGKFVRGTYTGAMILADLEDEDKARRALKETLGGMGVLTQMPTIQLERMLTAIMEEDLTLRDDFNVWDLATGRRDD